MPGGTVDPRAVERSSQRAELHLAAHDGALVHFFGTHRVEPEDALQALARASGRTPASSGDAIDLPHLVRDGHELEAFTTVAHDGRVYVPGKWVNWDDGDVLQRVSLTILDPATLSIVSIAEDDRCGAGGRVTFDSRGYAYVMGDGRNQSMQVFAAARGEPVVHNCLLRIPPGGTDFEEGFFYEIPGLTGGLDSMTEVLAADFNHRYLVVPRSCLRE